MRQKLGQHLAADRAGQAEAGIAVDGLAGVLMRPIVDKAVSRPGVEGNEPIGPPFRDEGDVRNAADVDKGGGSGMSTASASAR